MKFIQCRGKLIGFPDPRALTINIEQIAAVVHFEETVEVVMSNPSLSYSVEAAPKEFWEAIQKLLPGELQFISLVGNDAS